MSCVKGHVVPHRRDRNRDRADALAVRCHQAIINIRALVEANQIDVAFMQQATDRLEKMLAKLEAS